MKKLVLLLGLLACGPRAGQAQLLPLTHYTADSEVNALPSAEVHKVYQDRQGFIWFAVFSSGLVRYDGHQMTGYGVEDGLRDVNVWDVQQDGEGRLWVGSNTGLSVSEKPLGDYGPGARVRFTAVLDSIPLLDYAIGYNRMAVDAGGWVWVASDGQGLVRYRKTAGRALEVDTVRASYALGDARDASVRALAARRDGSVWASLTGGGLLAFEPGQQVPRRIAENLEAGGATTVLYEAPDGVLWGGRHDGTVWRLVSRPPGARVETVSTPLGVAVTSVLALQGGVLWVASEGAGIVEVRPAGDAPPRELTRANGLLSETIFHLMQDREGNVWIAQTGGVSKMRYNYAAFENITPQAPRGVTPLLPAPFVNAVRLGAGPGDPCRLWAATQEAGVTCIPPSGASVSVQQADGLRYNWVLGLEHDAQGRLWIGTLRGINVLALGATPLPPGAQNVRAIRVLGQPARVASYGLGYSILSVSTALLPPASPEQPSTQVVLFPAFHVLFALVDDAWVEFGPAQGLPESVLHAATLDHAGFLWVGSRDQGLYRSTRPLTRALLKSYAAGQAPIAFARVWSVDEGAPSNQIETLLVNGDDLWIGTPQGLVALDPAEVRVRAHLTRADGLRAGNATSLAVSPVTGRLWVGTNGGLAEIDPATRTVRRTVTKQDGLVDNEVWFYGSVVAGPDGRIYYGTAKGIAIYDPSRDLPGTVAPLLHLTRFEQHRNAMGQDEVAFEYAGLSFASERQVRYRTRLKGYDAGWSEPTADTRIRYTNLSAVFLSKKYTFQVQAANEAGVWTDAPLTYDFHVMPRLWLRWWAFLLYALVLAAGVFGVDRVQRRRLIAQERQRARERERELRLEAAEARASFLNAENERKTAELESARQLQLSMLPERLPEHPSVEVAAFMCTATEVGGDYYDFHLDGDATLTVALGDATGHGAAAGAVVTAVKGLFLLLAGEQHLDAIVRRATWALRQMKFHRMFMAMALARVRDHHIEFVGAGMPAALVYRHATQRVETVPLKGMPLGGTLNYPYQVQSIPVLSGDVVLMMTDGLAELFDERHEMYGYERVEACFARAAAQAPADIIAQLMVSAAQWLGLELQPGEVPDRELGNQDDITFVVLKVR